MRRHGTYKLFTVMHSVVKNVKEFLSFSLFFFSLERPGQDLFNPEDMARKDPEAPKPLEELEATGKTL